MSVMLMKQLVKRIAAVEKKIAQADPETLRQQIKDAEAFLKAHAERVDVRFRGSLEKQLEKWKEQLQGSKTDDYKKELKLLTELRDGVKGTLDYQRGGRKRGRKPKAKSA